VTCAEEYGRAIGRSRRCGSSLRSRRRACHDTGRETYVGHVPAEFAHDRTLGAVVGREHDDRVAFEVQLSQRIEHGPHDRIPLHQEVAELADDHASTSPFRIA
jgi:hypothetical protein